MSDKDDIEIIDPETYRPGGEKEFNHEALVMEAFRKCIEAGTHEFRAGYMNQKTDKLGNTIVSYVEDTRKKFIESVRTLRNVIICDVDDEAGKDIKKLMASLEDKKKELLAIQARWWKSLNLMQQKKANEQGHTVLEGAFNKNLPWYEEFIEDEVNTYRLLFEVFSKLTARLGFYQEVEIIG